MKKFIKKIIIIFYNIFFLSLGAVLIEAAVNNASYIHNSTKYFDSIAEFMQSPNYYMLFLPALGLTGVICVLFSISYMYLSIVRKKDRFIKFNNDVGEVSLSLNAVEDFLQKTGKNFGEVQDIVFTIKSTSKGIKINAKTILRESENIPEVVSLIQHKIKHRLKNILGINSVADIKVNIAKIVPVTHSTPLHPTAAMSPIPTGITQDYLEDESEQEPKE